MTANNRKAEARSHLCPNSLVACVTSCKALNLPSHRPRGYINRIRSTSSTGPVLARLRARGGSGRTHTGEHQASSTATIIILKHACWMKYD